VGVSTQVLDVAQLVDGVTLVNSSKKPVETDGSSPT